MSVPCAKCQTHFRTTKELLASAHAVEHMDQLIEDATAEFQRLMKVAKERMPDVSPMNYYPAKRAWMKLKRVEEQKARVVNK